MTYQKPNYAVRDALLKAQGGKTLIVEAKKAEIGKRVRDLKNLAFATFMGGDDSLIPEGGKVHKRPDVFFNSKDNMREIGRRGGKVYEDTLLALKYAYNDFYTFGRLGTSYRQAIEAILPVEFDKAVSKPAGDEVIVTPELLRELESEIEAFEEIASDVESSDGMERHIDAHLAALEDELCVE
jgi:hypothetical protein